jgi:hypothetical protein
MKKLSGLCLLICLLLTACQKPASDMDRFNQQMDQLITEMPITFEQLNVALGNRLHPQTGATEDAQGSLTKNVMIGDVKVDVIWSRKRKNTIYIYFEFSGNPCYNPKHFKTKYYSGQTPEAALADGVSSIYRYNNNGNGVGLMTVDRNGQECMTNIILRNGEATDPDIPI